jgi:hypothetical protein
MNGLLRFTTLTYLTSSPPSLLTAFDGVIK